MIDSSAFTKIEMQDIVGRLIGCCVAEDDKKMVKELIANESYHYIEPRHGKTYLSNI
jgi:transcriptional regulator